MNRAQVWLITAFGGVLLVIGIALGASPIHNQHGDSCGKAFGSNNSELEVLSAAGSNAQLVSAYRGWGDFDLGFGDRLADCENSLRSFRTAAFLLLGFGGVTLLVAGVATLGGQRNTPPTNVLAPTDPTGREPLNADV